MPALPKELWAMIAELVRQPMPHRNLIKDRRQIRQPGLASMMSVSILLNNVVAPFLYEFVITDSLYGLLWRYVDNAPVVPGICSKPELLKYVRTLYLEYPDRPLTETHHTHFNPPLPYRPHLIDRKPQTGFFWGTDTYHPDPAVASLIEAEWLFLKYPQTQLHLSMPDLETHCCGSLFGTDDSGWGMASSPHKDFRQRVREIQKVFARMYRSGKVVKYCQSGVYSPYCLDAAELHSYQPLATSGNLDPFSLPDNPSAIIPSTRPTMKSFAATPSNRSITVHVTLSDHHKGDTSKLASHMICIPNVKIQWVFDPKGWPERGPSYPFSTQALCESFNEALAHRHDLILAYHDPRKYPLKSMTVTAFIPLSDTLDIIREDMEEVSPESWYAARKAGKSIRQGDGVTVKPIEEYGCCRACQWVPGVRRGRYSTEGWIVRSEDPN